MVAAVGVLHRVSAQHVVRIMVLSSDEAVQVQLHAAEEGFAR